MTESNKNYEHTPTKSFDSAHEEPGSILDFINSMEQARVEKNPEKAADLVEISKSYDPDLAKTLGDLAQKGLVQKSHETDPTQ